MLFLLLLAAASACPTTLPYHAVELLDSQGHCVGWTCSPGTFHSGSMCRKCTEWVCAVGQYRAACTPAQDSACLDCPVLADTRSRYVGNTSCDDTVCMDGYVGTPCVVCPMGSYCVGGRYL